MDGTLQFHIEESFVRGSHSLFIARRHGQELYIAKPLEFVIAKRNEMQQPTAEFFLDDKFPDVLHRELRRIGIIEAADKATNDALRYHLEDMRHLVFNTKKGKR